MPPQLFRVALSVRAPEHQPRFPVLQSSLHSSLLEEPAIRYGPRRFRICPAFMRSSFPVRPPYKSLLSSSSCRRFSSSSAPQLLYIDLHLRSDRLKGRLPSSDRLQGSVLAVELNRTGILLNFVLSLTGKFSKSYPRLRRVQIQEPPPPGSYQPQ